MKPAEWRRLHLLWLLNLKHGSTPYGPCQTHSKHWNGSVREGFCRESSQIPNSTPPFFWKHTLAKRCLILDSPRLFCIGLLKKREKNRTSHFMSDFLRKSGK